MDVKGNRVFSITVIPTKLVGDEVVGVGSLRTRFSEFDITTFKPVLECKIYKRDLKFGAGADLLEISQVSPKTGRPQYMV